MPSLRHADDARPEPSGCETVTGEPDAAGVNQGRRRITAWQEMPGALVRFLSTHRVLVTLALIVAAGAFLRLIGLDWGLPLRLHPDEQVVVNGALDMARRNSFEPGYFMRPDHVPIQMSYLAYVAYGYLAHGVPAEVAFAESPDGFVMISRAITALFGTATIVLAYLVGSRFSTVTALIASALVAFFPPYIEHAHFATPDVPLTFMFVLLMLMCMRYLEVPSRRNLLGAAAVVAFAVAIKYPGALGSILIAVVVCMGAYRQRAPWRVLTHGAIAIGGVVGGLFIISPVLFTNANAVVEAIVGEARDSHLGADGLGWWGNLTFYLRAGLDAAGLLAAGAALYGVIMSIRQRARHSVPLWLGLGFAILLSLLPLHWERWGLPMHLTLLMFAAVGGGYAWRYASEEETSGRAKMIVIGVCGVVFINLGLAATATTARFIATDTRVVGLAEMDGMGMNRNNTIYEGYTPLSPGSPGVVFDRFEVVDDRLVLRDPDGADSGVTYLALSSDMGDRFWADERYASAQGFYRAVADQFPLLASFEPVAKRAAHPVEVVNSVDAIRYLWSMALGGNSGPTIVIHEIPVRTD